MGNKRRRGMRDKKKRKKKAGETQRRVRVDKYGKKEIRRRTERED